MLAIFADSSIDKIIAVFPNEQTALLICLSIARPLTSDFSSYIAPLPMPSRIPSGYASGYAPCRGIDVS